MLEPELPESVRATFHSHGMDPVRVLAFARQLGPLPPRALVVGCRPEVVPGGDGDDMVFELSEPVREAVGRAAELVRDLAGRFAAAGRFELGTGANGDSDTAMGSERDGEIASDIDRGGEVACARPEEKGR